MSKRRLHNITYPLVLMAAMHATWANADVTVERTVKFGGFAGMGAFEVSEKEYYQGMKRREESVQKFTGSILSKLTGAQQTNNIYRVDKDIIWELRPTNKTYVERSISSPPEPYQSPETTEENQSSDEPAESADSTPTAEEKPKVKIVRNEFKIDKTGEKKVINSFDCSKNVLTWLVEVEDLETKQRATNLMTVDVWTTPETGSLKTLREEELAYNQAYTKKLGLEITPDDSRLLGLNAMSATMGDVDTEKLAEEMNKIEGYPIATTVTWKAMGDPNAKPDAESTQEAKAETASAQDMDLSEGLGGLVGGFLKKQIEPAADKSTEKKKSANEVVLFESYIEVRKVDTGSLGKEIFEIPTGFTKTDI